MAYANFTLEMVRKQLEVSVEMSELFTNSERIEIPASLREALADGMKQGLISEKARSEFIVAPILLAIRRLMDGAFSIYSGARLDVDAEKGLIGECDFILSPSPAYPELRAPFVMLLEAKKGDIEASLGQCAAQMVGARIFNEREGLTGIRLMGGVTSGELWQFLELHGNTLRIDQTRYYLSDLEKLLGVLRTMLKLVIPAKTAAA